MADREKVIAMLKCIANLETVYVADCKRRECPYAGIECMRAVAVDALALLKEQEARVLDWNEIGTVDGAVWLEDRYENEVVPGLVMQMHSAVNLDIKKDGKPRTASASRSDYGDRWRAWSARPTEEQRKAVAWEPPKGDRHVQDEN